MASQKAALHPMFIKETVSFSQRMIRFASSGVPANIPPGESMSNKQARALGSASKLSRSEERRVGKGVYFRGRRFVEKKKTLKGSVKQKSHGGVGRSQMLQGGEGLVCTSPP